MSLALLATVTGPCRAAAAEVAPVTALAETEFARAAHAQGLAPEVLYALALLRSGQADAQGTAAPWPWTLRTGSRTQRFDNREQAQMALRQGPPKEMEVGLTGLSVRYWGGRTPQPADLLDPGTNLNVAAAIVAEGLRATPQDRALAVGRVVFPETPEAARHLGARVLAVADRLSGRAPPPAAPAAPAIRRIGAPPAPDPTPPTRQRSASLGADRAVVAELIRAAARRHGVDPAFALAIAKHESGFRQSAVSPAGALGVMQLMPQTAARFGANPRDLHQNINAGVRYLRWLAELFNGDPRLVAAGYNAGERAVIRAGFQIPPYRETKNYVPSVINTWGLLWAQTQTPH